MKQAKYIGMALHQATISVALVDRMLGLQPDHSSPNLPCLDSFDGERSLGSGPGELFVTQRRDGIDLRRTPRR
jgi:hypothetical protein